MKRAAVFLLATFMVLSVAAQDVSLDKKLGAENSLMVEQEMGIYQHDSLHQLVNSVGKKLVSRLKDNPFEFKFFLVDSPEPNAFALPGGYIYVTRGILLIINTEDELAGIMAHEIIHVMQRHSIKQMKKGIVTDLIQIPGNVVNTVTGTNLGNVINTPISVTTGAFIAKYSRGHESEADKFGIQLAASAGYKTDALADALDRLAKEVELLTGEAEQHSYFSDHPYTPSRISTIRSSASIYRPVNSSPIYSSREKFLSNFNGLCFGLNPEQGVFTDSLFVQPDFGIAWITPSGWETMNKPLMVAAYSEKGDAIVAMRVVSEKKTIRELGEAAKEETQKTTGTTIAFAGDTLINSFAAYMLRIKSIDKGQEKISELIWLNNQQTVFQLVGVATTALQKDMHKALCSFRKSKQEELQKIKEYKLHVVRAHANETTEKMNARVGNQLNPSITQVINNHDSKTTFKEGELVKIVKSGTYQPKR